MQTINRLLTNICSDKLQESKDFYTKLFRFEVNFDSDWFIHLTSENRQLELGIIDRTHQIVPTEEQANPAGIYLTFVVDAVDEVYEIAVAQHMHVLQQPEDTFYGQRRLLLKDPNGVIVDVSSPISQPNP